MEYVVREFCSLRFPSTLFRHVPDDLSRGYIIFQMRLDFVPHGSVNFWAKFRISSKAGSCEQWLVHELFACWIAQWNRRFVTFVLFVSGRSRAVHFKYEPCHHPGKVKRHFMKQLVYDFWLSATAKRQSPMIVILVLAFLVDRFRYSLIWHLVNHSDKSSQLDFWARIS